MNKEYKIKLDLNKKLYNKKMAFNQFDENVNDFYIEVTKNNKVVKDLDKSIVTLVAIKPSGEVDAQFIEVKEGQIYADLKPSMCDLVGNYQAKAMIVLEGEIVTTDTINYSVNEDKIISKLNDDVVSDERFTLFTDALARLSTIEISEEQRMINEAERILSEENRKIEEAKRVEAELIRQHEEADRTKYDAIRESNENIRKINEEARISSENVRLENEANRIEQEANRVKAEQLRKDNYNFMTEDEERRRSEANAHKEAEALRVQAETNRVNEEAKRRTTEQARVSAENTRVNNENTRKANEIFRENNETQRVEAETQRQNRYNSFITEAEANANNFENYTNNAKVKEEERKANELDRKSQEAKRASNEVERISNENTRKVSENARIESEKQRVDAENLRKEKIIEIQTDYDSLKKVIIDENASANLQNQINQTNSQLEHKANSHEVRKNNVSIKMEDLHTEVKSAMTGGSVAVVGENAVGKENVKPKAIGISKIDHSIAKNPLTNLLSTELYTGTGKNGASFTTEDNNTFIVTSTTNYGTFNRILKVEDVRKYIVISKCRVIEGDDVYARHICYCYSEDGTNLGATDSVRTLISSDYTTIVTKLDIKPGGVTGHFGFCLSKECKVEVKNQIILDVTGLADEDLAKIDFTKFNNGYWEDAIQNIMLYAELCNKSKTSEYAENANTANFAFDGNFAKYTEKYKNIIGSYNEFSNSLWGNGATITKFDDKEEWLVTPNASWGECLIRVNNLEDILLTNRKYKMVVKVKTKDVRSSLKCTAFFYTTNTHSGSPIASRNKNIGFIDYSEYSLITWDLTIDYDNIKGIALGISNTNSNSPYPSFYMKEWMIIDITDDELTDEQVLYLSPNSYWENTVEIIEKAEHSLTSDTSKVALKALSLDESVLLPNLNKSKWEGKNALVIGDSITAAGQWQLKLKEELGMNVTTHAKGGIGIIAMTDGDKGLGGDYDNETNASGEIKPLDADKVRDKDLIVILPAYNERAREYGQIGDLYPSQSTIIGMMQYQINRIYEELTNANNLNCKVLIATPHCAGKYNYVDADGYEQYPANSGRTMQTLSNTIKEICNYNNIPVCDLWHNSGINKFTWSIYGAQANAVNENYTKYELNAQGDVIGEVPLRYVTGQSYYQWRDGSVVLEKYTGASPYPFNGDQLHCSTKGYARIGECIVGSIIKSYGY